MRIDVALTPQGLTRRGARCTCVVVDVLRASSSIVTALENGCVAIYPVAEPPEVFPLANHADVLACGERRGVKIPGYDLGNSPGEFERQTVGGKRLVMCTTNGTGAIRAAAGLGRTLIGCFLNAPTIASCLEQAQEDVTIVCAGREGRFSIEDALCAGMIVADLDGEMTDAAMASAAIYEAYLDRVEEVLEESEHGRFLRRIGFGEDIAYCARVGVSEIIPEAFPSGQPAPHDLVIRAARKQESLQGGSND
jgi:2-phosphosulfolactate phosphatase